MRQNPILIPMLCLLLIGISFWLISFPSPLERFHEHCEQQYIIGEGQGSFDAHGRELCNCLAVTLGEELKPGAFKVAIEIFDSLDEVNDVRTDAAVEKLKAKNANAMIKFEKTIRYCHPHYGPVPDALISEYPEPEQKRSAILRGQVTNKKLSQARRSNA